MSKNRGIETHVVTFDVYAESPSACGDIQDRLWNAFEQPVSFSDLYLVDTHRTINEVAGIEPDEQNGDHVWHGVLGIQIRLEVRI